jgi:hypothetical protein
VSEWRAGYIVEPAAAAVVVSVVTVLLRLFCLFFLPGVFLLLELGSCLEQGGFGLLGAALQGVQL